MRICALILLLLAPVMACAAFYPEDHFGRIADEITLIVWNQETKTEHFIRKVRFQGDSAKLGFVVPTPTEPKVAEIDDSLFYRLDRASRPEKIAKRAWQLGTFLGCSYLGADTQGNSEIKSTVDVFQTGQVAGQDYAVLKAQDPEALSTWLEANGFNFPESHKSWAKEYIEQGYFFTAFKYSSEQEQNIISSAIRLSFQSDKAFYPYREPEGTKGSGERNLRLYLLSDKRLAGSTEQGAWTAEERFAAPLDKLPEELQTLTSGKLLTVFDDTRTDRNGLSDLFFEPNPDQSQLIPEPRVVNRTTILPVELIFFVVALVVFLKRRKR